MPEIVLEILVDYRSSFSDELERLVVVSSAEGEADWEGFFHRAKGSGSTLGLVALQAQCTKLEAEAKGAKEPNEADLKEFRALLAASCEEAAQFLGSL